MTFLLYLFLTLTIIFFLLLCFVMLGYALGYFLTKVPFISSSSSKKNLLRILEIMDLKEKEIFVDLGCGDGRLLVEAEKKYKIQGIGYDLSPAAYLLTQLNKFLRKSKIKIYFQDFLKADLSTADVIFCYLFPFLMKKVSKKLRKELKPGARIYSFAFTLPDWSNEKIEYLDKKNKKGKIFIYQK